MNSMKRPKSGIRFGLILAGILSLTLQTATPGAARPPNIVLMTGDNLGYSDLGCYGNKVNQTPKIDRLASQGVRLTSFYTAGATCTVSRAALLTGRYPQRIGLNHQLSVDENRTGMSFSVIAAATWTTTPISRPASMTCTVASSRLISRTFVLNRSTLCGVASICCLRLIRNPRNLRSQGRPFPLLSALQNLTAQPLWLLLTPARLSPSRSPQVRC